MCHQLRERSNITQQQLEQPGDSCSTRDGTRCSVQRSDKEHQGQGATKCGQR